MKKLAIFVEGMTEMILLEKIIPELAGHGAVRVVVERQHSGTTRVIRAFGPKDTATYEVLIVNCECDGKVKPFLLERRKLLESKGYSVLLGLQDVYPHFQFHELDKVREGIRKGVPDDAPFVKLCLAVMEVEAWFLNEATHFERINAKLTKDFIKQSVNFNPAEDIAEETVPNPAKLLRKIYQLVGLDYDKHASEVYRTVNALDVENFLLVVREMSKSLHEFLGHVDEFLTVKDDTPDEALAC